MKRYLITLALLLFTSGCATGGAKPSKATSPAPSSSPDVQATEQLAKAPAATEKTEAEKSQVTCVHESDTRVLNLQEHGNGCNLNYTKYGKTASVAKSTSGTEACEKIEQKIRSKLESNGYNCK